MASYVDVDKLNTSDYIEIWECNCSENGRQVVMAVDDLHYLPTVDVQEVKHGKWVISEEEFRWDGDNRPIEVYCNSCRGVISYLDSELYFYCPYCGAKMNKE